MSKAFAYIFTFAGISAAFALTFVLKAYLQLTPTLLFMLVVLFSSLYGGLVPGLFASLLSVLLITFFFMEPIYSFRIESISDTIQLTVFVIAAVLISGLNQAKRRAQEAHTALLQKQLEETAAEVRILRGLLPICSGCKKIRDDGKWTQLESYLQQHSEAQFTHGICPDCKERLYPGL